MSAVNIDAGPVAYRCAGDPGATKVVFLHGLGGGRTAWEPQLEALSDRWHCVAWDMPGYGASAPPEGPLELGSIADAAVGLLDELDVADAHLVGLSFGGMHAQHVAITHPDRVRSLTLVDTSPAFGLDGTTRDDWLVARLGAFERADPADPTGKDAPTGNDAPTGLADIAEAVVSAIAAPGFAGRGFEESVASFGRIDVDAFRAACHALVDHDLRGRLGVITAPTLVVVGEHDTETPRAYAEAIADEISGAHLVEIAGAGHLVPAEAPEAFNALLADFLAAVDAGGQTPFSDFSHDHPPDSGVRPQNLRLSDPPLGRSAFEK